MAQKDKIGKDGLLAFYQGQLRQMLQDKAGPFLYRGQEDAAWPLQSGATQRIRESNGEQPIKPEDFIKYHQDLIDTVRSKGWSPTVNKTPSDLEILATLQHNGAATCLLDFTSRFDTALWFACRGKHDEDGKVFVVGINHYDPTPYKVTAEETKEPIEKILKFQTGEEEKAGEESRFWHWDPEVLMERMLSQSSQFLFGPQDIPEGGFCKSIVIKKYHKKELLEELQKQQGLRPETVFADIHGFADANARSVPLNPAAASFFRGNAKLDRGDFNGAIADYDETIRLKPDSASAWNNRGVAKGNTGNHDDAIADYDEAIRLKPDDAETWNNRGIAKSEKGDLDGATTDYDEAIRLKPDLAHAWNNRGLAKRNKGDHDGAIADFDEAIRLQPDDAKIWNSCGNAKSEKGYFDDAIADFDEAIRLQPNYAEAWNNRGIAKDNKGDHDGAIVDFDEAIRLQSKIAVVWNNRGNAKLAKDDSDGAIADYDEAIRLFPELAEAWNNRGEAKIKKGDLDGAIADFDEAIRLRPDMAEAIQNRKIALEKQQKTTK